MTAFLLTAAYLLGSYLFGITGGVLVMLIGYVMSCLVGDDDRPPGNSDSYRSRA